MIRLLIGIILLAVSSCEPVYADDLTIITQPYTLSTQRPGETIQSVTVSPPTAQTTFTPPQNSYDVCDQLVPYTISSNPPSPVYVLAGATWRQLIIPYGDSDRPLDLSGSTFAAEFVPDQPVSVPVDVTTTIEEFSYAAIAAIPGDEFTPGQDYVPAQTITSWTDVAAYQGRSYPLDFSMTTLPANYQLLTPTVTTTDPATGYTYKKWIVSRTADFNSGGSTQAIPLTATVTITPGLLDIRLPASQTRKMDGWAGTLYLFLTNPTIGATVGAVFIPLVFYPTVTRLP